ncbi:hypothetical protein Droror1_Dr00011718 [Drosera rotundifolia]
MDSATKFKPSQFYNNGCVTDLNSEKLTFTFTLPLLPVSTAALIHIHSSPPRHSLSAAAAISVRHRHRFCLSPPSLIFRFQKRYLQQHNEVELSALGMGLIHIYGAAANFGFKFLLAI